MAERWALEKEEDREDFRQDQRQWEAGEITQSMRVMIRPRTGPLWPRVKSRPQGGKRQQEAHAVRRMRARTRAMTAQVD